MKRRILLLTLPVIALAACGGGGDKAAPASTSGTSTTASSSAPVAATATTYPPGSDKDDGNVDAAEAEAIRNDLRSQNYKVVADMFTDERLQTIATKSCSRASQYDNDSGFYGGEFPVIVDAVGLETSAFKTVEADTNWSRIALVDAAGTACGTEVARIESAR